MSYLLESIPSGHPHLETLKAVINSKDDKGGKIDSRLNAVQFDMYDETDKYDRILYQKRWGFYVRRPEDFAILLYRLDRLALDRELGIEDGFPEDAEELYWLIWHDCLGMPEEMEPWLSDDICFEGCGNCDQAYDSEYIEIQDQFLVCHKCGYEANYQTEWPYVYNGMRMLGRLDKVVKEYLEKSLQPPTDEEE